MGREAPEVFGFLPKLQSLNFKKKVEKSILDFCIKCGKQKGKLFNYQTTQLSKASVQTQK